MSMTTGKAAPIIKGAVTNKREATGYQPAPTGEGSFVLPQVEQLISQLIVGARIPGAILKESNLLALEEDLRARAEQGKAKYGTYLRTYNGRKAIVDLYQELQDAVMYAAQARMEQDAEGGAMLELLINLASQIAGEINKRNG